MNRPYSNEWAVNYLSIEGKNNGVLEQSDSTFNIVFNIYKII